MDMFNLNIGFLFVMVLVLFNIGYARLFHYFLSLYHNRICQFT